MQYSKFTSVFGEEEFNTLPLHQPYDIDIELKEDTNLGHAPLYSMTPAESKELKSWLDKELSLGKITASKSPIASPVMFVKKRWVTLCRARRQRRCTKWVWRLRPCIYRCLYYVLYYDGERRKA